MCGVRFRIRVRDLKLEICYKQSERKTLIFSNYFHTITIIFSYLNSYGPVEKNTVSRKQLHNGPANCLMVKATTYPVNCLTHTFSNWNGSPHAKSGPPKTYIEGLGPPTLQVWPLVRFGKWCFLAPEDLSLNSSEPFSCTLRKLRTPGLTYNSLTQNITKATIKFHL